MCLEGLLLGGRQLGFLAGAYAANVLVFLTSLYAIARRALGLRYVWAALAAFQLVSNHPRKADRRHASAGLRS